MLAFKEFLAIFSILIIGMAIIICYIIYLKIQDKRMEETRRYCIELTKLNAENKSPYMKEMMTEEIIREIRRIRSELNSVFDKLENMKLE